MTTPTRTSQAELEARLRDCHESANEAGALGQIETMKLYQQRANGLAALARMQQEQTMQQWFPQTVQQQSPQHRPSLSITKRLPEDAWVPDCEMTEGAAMSLARDRDFNPRFVWSAGNGVAAGDQTMQQRFPSWPGRSSAGLP